MFSGGRWRGASGVCSGDGVWRQRRAFFSGRAVRVWRRERERAMTGTVKRKGIPRGLFIGKAGPLTARINCARPERAPGYVTHVRVVCGVTVASCNGHIVGHDVQLCNARSPRESRRRPFESENTQVLTQLDLDWVPRDVCDGVQRISVRVL